MGQRRTRNGHESPYERWEVKGREEPVVKTKKRLAKQDENQRAKEWIDALWWRCRAPTTIIHVELPVVITYPE
jgi:hypothetical protein